MRKNYKRMSATKRAYLNGLKKGKRIGFAKAKRRTYRRSRW